MTATAIRPSDIIVAVSAAVVLHVLLFLAFVGLVAWGLLTGKLEIATEPTPPPAVVIEIRPEMFERPKPAVVEEVPEIKKRLATTSPAQESEEAPENAVYVGERNTKAASDLPPDPDGPAVPSQDGREPRPGEVDTFDSTFADGAEPDVASEPDSPKPQAPTDPVRQPTEPVEPTEPVADPADVLGELPPPSEAKPEELLKTETQVPIPEDEEMEKEDEEETLPKESESEADPLSENQPGGAQEKPPVEESPPPKDPGFQTESSKTRLRGSIGRKGTTALDVEDSPIGRYQAKLSRAVERQWQMNCIQYRDHIVPGSLSVRFLLDEKGDVSGLRFLQILKGGEIQQGFTLKSIKQADIPAMPKDVQKELNGDPLELIYNFYF